MWNKRGTAEDGGYEVMTIHKPIPFGHVIYQKLKRAFNLSSFGQKVQP
jgi:hypothetical protein